MPLRLIDSRRVKMQLQWEPRDFWFGFFWRVNPGMVRGFRYFHLYVCVVPLVLLHVRMLLVSNVSISGPNGDNK